MLVGAGGSVTVAAVAATQAAFCYCASTCPVLERSGHSASGARKIVVAMANVSEPLGPYTSLKCSCVSM